MTGALLPALPGDWSCFVADYWESRPKVFRSLIPKPSSVSRTLFQAAVSAVRNNIQGRGSRLRFVSSRNVSQGSSPPLPARSDGGFEAYLNRAAAESRSRDVTFILNAAQASSASLFDGSLSFLSGLFTVLGTPLDTDSVIFATRSHVSALGIHRDPYSNFLFLADGEKTFLLWPANAVRGGPEVVPAAELPALRSSAERIHLKAGDALYMPSGYYHCAIQNGFSVHLSIILSTIGDRAAQKFLWRELEPFLRNSFGGSETGSVVMNQEGAILTTMPDCITLPLRHGLAKIQTAGQTIRSAFLRTQSAGGFSAVPPERPPAPLRPSDWVSARRSNLRVMNAGPEILVAACGHEYHCPAHPSLVELLQTLMNGEPVAVRDLLRRFAGTARIGTEEVSLDARWILLFLGNLYRARWLNVVRAKQRNTRVARRSARVRRS